jgi:type I restriction enzyme S subunit
VSIPLPSLPEQDAIVKVLSHAERLIEKYAGAGAFTGKQASSVVKRGLAGRGVALLGEYRTRLIADVVTGRLDVRAVAAGLSEAAEESEPIEPDDADLDEAALDDEAGVEEVA